MLRLSIVIPALGDTTRLENGLVSVLENRPADAEVIVVLGSEYDDPYGLAGEEVRFVEAPARAGLAECANLGIIASRAPVVHLLGCGCEAAPGWADAALAHFADPRVAAVAPLVLEAGTAPRRVLAAGVELDRAGRRLLAGRGAAPDALGPAASFILGPAVFAAFYRVEALNRLGTPLEPSLGDCACDVDLALRLARVGYLALLEPAARIAADARWAGDEPCGYAQALHAERLRRRHVAADRSLAVRMAHAAAVAGEITRGLFGGRGLAQLAGRLQGTLESGRHRRLQHELARVRAEMAGQTSAAAECLRLDDTHDGPQPKAGERRRAGSHR